MKPTIKDVDAFFKNLGLDEDIHKLAEVYTKQFMIEGEVTEDLQEVLHRAPDSLIDLIWDNIENDSIENVERNKKEEILLKDIPKFLEMNLIYLKPSKLKLLIQVMNQHPVDIMDTTIINEEFIPKGWVFNFTMDNNNCIFVVTEQIRHIVMKIEQEETKMLMSFVFGLRSVMNTCIRLYGVFSQELFVNLYKKVVLNGQDYESLNLHENVEIILNKFEEEILIYRKGNNIVSSKIQSETQYNQIIELQKGKTNYIPSDNDIAIYALGDWVDKTPEYKAVYQCLTREIKDSEQAEEMLEEIIRNIVIDDWGIPQIMNCLYQWDVAFDNSQSARRMTKALSDWIYSVRRWSEYGYSRKEKQIPNNQDEYIAFQDNNFKQSFIDKKIYPNDPCPCGSGKKYKKCCG